MNEVIDLIARATGKRIDVRREPTQKGDMRDTFADTSAARDDLRWAPKTSLADGISAEVRWLQEALPLLTS